MEDLIQEALNTLEGKNLDYGEIRLIDRISQDITIRNGVIETIGESIDIGYGIRVFKNGGMGFVASNNLTKENVAKVASRAVCVAEESSKVLREPFYLGEPEKPLQGTYKTPHKKDPFEIPLGDKIELLLKIDEILRKKKEIALSSASLSFFKTKKYFASTQGHQIKQEILESGGGYTVYAFKDGELQMRSYPGSHGGNYHTAGWEFVESLNLIGEAERVREEAIMLLRAPECPEGIFDIVLLPGQMVLQIHESIGHPTELDRVLGYEASYAGTSFATPDLLSSFKYASPIVNITADATLAEGLGTFGFDDEGTPGKKVYLLKNGILNDYLSSRDTAYKIGRLSSGAARASNWNRIPIVRMTNINLEPGEMELEDMISDIEEGILMDVNKSWSIDEKRLNFQFACEIAWKIEKGKKKEILKNPLYYGITPEFWNSCDAVGNKKYYKLFGLLSCGKGEPGQTMHVGHGTPPSRFRNVQCGSKK